MDPINGHQVRIRIGHTFTQKGGWKHDSTVDITGNANDPIDVERQIESWLRRVDDLGRAESRTRNRIDRFEDAA